MKKLLLMVSILTATWVAQANAQEIEVANDPQLLGKWISTHSVYEGNGMTIYLGIEMTDGAGILSSICKFPGNKDLEASVSVPTTGSNGIIVTKGSGKNEVVDGPRRCSVNVEPATINYQFVNGGYLRLTMQGQSLDFTKR